MKKPLPHTILGYHGCDREIGEAIVLGKEKFHIRENKYDWLGSGIYFWENSPARALEWAKACVASPRLTRGSIKEPFVIGAIIDLQNCLDLTDMAYMGVLRGAYFQLQETFNLMCRRLPENKDANHQLDCMVINTAISLNNRNGNGQFDTVRGAYLEGEPIYPGAKILEKTHIQVCVRNLDCILGFFVPAI
ncbi:MAG: hypothetical protein IKS20_02250 [Victivallales bacterium]|nr:hypothetical protein [Victivallales bacterium]